MGDWEDLEQEQLPSETLEEENPEQLENEPVEEPDSLDSQNKTHPIKDAIGVGTREGIKKLVTNKYFLIFVAGVIFFFGIVALLVFQMDFDIHGIGNIKPIYYTNTPDCGKVYLTWESEAYTTAHKNDEDYKPITDPTLIDLERDKERFEYKEYDFDTYISGIVWTENDKAKDVDNEIVYQAMAIVSRSRLIANLSDNCVVLRDYSEQAKSFTELSGNEKKYTEITQAVANSKGIIIGKNNQIFSKIYESFNYIKKRKENEAGYENQYFYHMVHENEEKQQVIPASWVEELEKEKGVKIPKQKTNSIKKLESMSIYGAKYLNELKDTDYGLYRILEYYFGRDIDYYTIDENASFDEGTLIGIGSGGCMWWPIGSDETTIEDGITFAKGAPVSTKITSGFGNRDKPTAGASTFHPAIDIGGTVVEGQTNIIASADGEVITIHTGCVAGNFSCGGGLGNYVKIKHNDGTITRYGHMHSVSVVTGQKVKQGQVIGKLGNTGVSTGRHLDFQVLENGNAVNPLNYISATNPRPTSCGNNVFLPPNISAGGDGKKAVCIGFLQAGYTPAQVAGVMVNVNGESGFKPNAFNPRGGGIGAYGLFQWRAGRQRALKALQNYDTAEVQVAFAISELQSSEKNANKHLKAATTPSDASYNFCVYYERAGTTLEEMKKNCLGRKTTSLTNTFYNYAQNGCQ